MFEIINTFKAFRKLRTDEQGVAALEYGLIAAVVGTAVIALATPLQTFFTSLFTKLGNLLAGA